MAATLSPQALRICPLGGLGEIGMNCMALEQAEGTLLVDCGTAFPIDDRGIDVITPDFRYLERGRGQLSGLVLTHGHEDHIGAIPYLLRRFTLPIFGPRHALALVKRRLAEHELNVERLELIETRAGQRFSVGPFEVEPIHVSHSIVDATALAIRTAQGTVLHTGDFDFDPEPLDGEPTSEERFLELGLEGVELLLSDSTNVHTPVRSTSEKRVSEALKEAILAAPGRAFVALFASNLPRLRALGEIAHRCGRRLGLLGRSLENQVEVGRALGILRWPSDLVAPAERLRDVPAHQLLILAGGSQAERASALYRLAKGDHRYADVEPGDSVFFSSRTIPGNERPVGEVICDLLRRGARVVTVATDPEIHVSGHASREELAHMIELVRPRNLVPIHGTLQHLLEHAALARSLGVPCVQVIENGESLRLADSLRRDLSFPTGRIAIDLGGQPLGETELSSRGELGRHGVVLVSLVVDPKSMLVVPPSITLRGVPSASEGEFSVRGLTLAAARAAAHARKRGRGVEEEVRRALRHAIAESTGSRPTIEIHLCEVPG